MTWVAFFVLFVSSSWAGSSSLMLDECALLSSNSLDACIGQIQSQVWWEPLRSNLRRAKDTWPGPLPIRFEASLDRSAKVIVEQVADKILPVILVGKNETHELVLAINHELVHYVNVHERLKFIKDENKIKGCLTRYQLSTLKDEIPAFEAEIAFWNNAPASFKNRFEKFRFDSKLLGKKDLSYDRFYRALKKKLTRDKAFVAKRYIEMDEYPKCAATFFD